MNNLNVNEKLLEVWLKLSAVLRNQRFMSDLSFNEAFICSLIDKQKREFPDHPYLPIREICNYTRLLKSQVNRTISELEQRGLVERFRQKGDRRLVYVRLCEEKMHIFQQEHESILAFVDRLIARIGIDDTLMTIKLLNKISNQVELLLDEGDNKL